MHPIINALEDDHKRIICLMFSLRNELTNLPSAHASQPDFHKIFEIIDYMKTVPTEWHHPIETIVYDYYFEHIDPQCELAMSLQQQHVKLQLLSDRLEKTLSTAKAMMDRKACDLIRLFTQYQSLQLSHIAKERELFKIIDKKMNDDNWAAIEKTIALQELTQPENDKFLTLEYYRSMGDGIAKEPLITEKMLSS